MKNEFTNEEPQQKSEYHSSFDKIGRINKCWNYIHNYRSLERNYLLWFRMVQCLRTELIYDMSEKRFKETKEFENKIKQLMRSNMIKKIRSTSYQTNPSLINDDLLGETLDEYTTLLAKIEDELGLGIKKEENILDMVMRE